MTPAWTATRDASLRARNTFGVDATAPVLVDIADAAALPEVLARHADDAPLLLGGGSNLLFAENPPGAVIALVTRGIATVEDGELTIVRADAGVTWHEFVLWTLARGLCGLENLALIPGTVGAAPIQNIGAYGVEVRECIHAVETFDRRTGAIARLDNAACAFAYRDSLFKRDPERHVVTAVEFALPRTPALRLDYAGIGGELATMGIAAPTPAQVAEAVIRIRRRKLPDPVVLGNAGSFFKNPIVSAAQAEALHAEHASLPVFPLAPFPADAAAHGQAGDGGLRKLSAAWLIDQCGWKGHRDGDAGVAAAHALVLVNHGHATGAQLLDLARRIADSVQARFGVAIEPEPRIVGATW